jgi:predicted ATPase
MLDRSLEDTLPYLFALLGIDDPTASLQQMDPQIRRRRTFEAVKRLVLRESLNQPLILIFEDLHWIDGETQGLLDVFSESVASARILLLTNYRPEYRSEWGQKTYYTQLRLAPLGKAEAKELLTCLLGNDASLTALKQLILEKTEGTPFFMEEVVQTLAEEGFLGGERGHYGLAKAPTTLHISPTVQGVLAARIDRLAPDEKALLQHLAILGREFPLGLVRHVVPQSEEELYRLLASLQRKEFLYEQPAFPEVEYIFKHALTQEVAYGTVLQERRKMLHERTAQALEALYFASLDEHYGDLAHHYTRGGNTQKAVEYLELAGQQAVQRSANAEAITHLTTALELLKTFPNTPEHTQQELTLQLALVVPLRATKGYASPEVEKCGTRARELCQQVGETPQLLSALFGLWVAALLRAELQTARELGAQCLRIAQDVQDPAFLMLAHWAVGETSLYLGELASARAHLEQGIVLYDPQQHRSHVFQYGQDSGVFCLIHAAWSLWLSGYPDQALKRSHEALTLAQELAHPNSLGGALDVTGFVRQFRREEHVVREQGEAAITLSTEHGLPFWLAAGTILRGWALAEQGQGEEGITQIQQGMADWRATGAEAVRPHFLALLAEAYGKVGQTENGLNTLAEARALVDKTGERVYEAELYRLKGTLTLQSQASLGQISDKSQASQDKSEVADPRPLIPDPQGEAEACFLKAIQIARKQQAKSLELRATMNLARLWRQQGKATEAHEMLAAVYNWFTEGFDTADLQDAKRLIEE